MTTLEPTATTNQQGIVKRVYQAFFSPGKYDVKSLDREIIEWGNNYRLPFEGGELAVTTWGSSGPAVLLMHGWGGARAQMTGLVDPSYLRDIEWWRMTNPHTATLPVR
ncbi:MAG TPA: hypothetical protein VF918_09980 [Anaerolineales bacterium]